MMAQFNFSQVILPIYSDSTLHVVGLIQRLYYAFCHVFTKKQIASPFSVVIGLVILILHLVAFWDGLV